MKAQPAAYFLARYEPALAAGGPPAWRVLHWGASASEALRNWRGANFLSARVVDLLMEGRPAAGWRVLEKRTGCPLPFGWDGTVFFAGETASLDSAPHQWAAQWAALYAALADAWRTVITSGPGALPGRLFPLFESLKGTDHGQSETRTETGPGRKRRAGRAAGK